MSDTIDIDMWAADQPVSYQLTLLRRVISKRLGDDRDPLLEEAELFLIMAAGRVKALEELVEQSPPPQPPRTRWHDWMRHLRWE